MTEFTRQTIRTYLERRGDSDPIYLKVCDIADEIGGTPKSVAQHLRRLQDELTGISLEQWGRSKARRGSCGESICI